MYLQAIGTSFTPPIPLNPIYACMFPRHHPRMGHLVSEEAMRTMRRLHLRVSHPRALCATLPGSRVMRSSGSRTGEVGYACRVASRVDVLASLPGVVFSKRGSQTAVFTTAFEPHLETWSIIRVGSSSAHRNVPFYENLAG